MLYNSNIIIVKQSRARQGHVIRPIKVEDAKPGKWLRRAATRFEDTARILEHLWHQSEAVSYPPFVLLS